LPCKGIGTVKGKTVEGRIPELRVVHVYDFATITSFLVHNDIAAFAFVKPIAKLDFKRFLEPIAVVCRGLIACDGVLDSEISADPIFKAIVFVDGTCERSSIGREIKFGAVAIVVTATLWITVTSVQKGLSVVFLQTSWWSCVIHTNAT
jgi:hypothetical protein